MQPFGCLSSGIVAAMEPGSGLALTASMSMAETRKPQQRRAQRHQRPRIRVTWRKFPRRARRSSMRSCAGWAKRKWRVPPHHCGGQGSPPAVDQFFAAGAGDPQSHLPDAPLAAAGYGLWLLRRLSDGGARPPAIVHREHHHGGAAGVQGISLGQHLAHGRGCGRSCWSPNFVGTLFAALFCTYTPVLPPELLHGMLDISRACWLAGGTWPSAALRPAS